MDPSALMGLPPLAISSGPAVSDAGGGNGSSTTGAIYFGSPQGPSGVSGLIQTALPWVAVGVIVWALTR